MIKMMKNHKDDSYEHVYHHTLVTNFVTLSYYHNDNDNDNDNDNIIIMVMIMIMIMIVYDAYDVR